MCKFLIEHGAEINRKGGESVATPLQWAAQRCHYYTVNLLLQHGADPLITDAQGYNTLHISTFNGNVLLIVLLLHQGIPVDVLDSFGHTALMWAAYKGFPQCVDVFLRWGADVHGTDEQGFTPLHWALVKGNPMCVMKLIEYGADRFAKTETGKTPEMTATELGTDQAWHSALRECGYDEDGQPVMPPWPGATYFLQDKRNFVLRFTFLMPFLLVWAMIMVLSHSPVFLGIPLAIFVGFSIQYLAQQVLQYAPSTMRAFHKTVRAVPSSCIPVLTLAALAHWHFCGIPVPRRHQLAFGRSACNDYGRRHRWRYALYPEHHIRHLPRPHDLLLRGLHAV